MFILDQTHPQQAPRLQPDICPQKQISPLLLKASLASLQPTQQPTRRRESRAATRTRGSAPSAR
uniref:Uncharacterized protein n=1 Tax=Arundo donax TaxID=35708 RepID=A0A0A9CBZ7_ARUDO